MQFNSLEFGLLLGVTWLVFATLAGRLRIGLLIASSFVFYATWNVPLVSLTIERNGILLRASASGMGNMDLETLPDGTFGVEVEGRGYIRMEFVEGERGEVDGMLMHLREGQEVNWERIE